MGMKIDRRTFVAASTAVAVPSRLLAASSEVFQPEDFGARGDGVSNDTPAFALLSDAVNRRGGGTISLRAGRTYMVGEQARGGAQFGWAPLPVLALHDLTAPLTIIGNGSRLRWRFGTFDLETGAAIRRPMPNLRSGEAASPYRALIHVKNCRAPIEIHDIELDGSLERLRIGGPYGDTGWQLPATGLLLEGNLEREIVHNIYSHHHAQDGVMIVGDGKRSARSRFTQLVCVLNGRQRLSLTGGRGYDFEDCEFSRSGRSAIWSAPGAGVDIEAENPPIRDVSFMRCKFIDNSGTGLGADSGDSANARFTDCLFVGATNWSAWPNKPGFRFDRCTFVGAVVHAFPDADPSRAARFTECRFTDDPKLSPTRKVFVGNGPIVDLATSDNVLFDRCRFDLLASGMLPWSWRATYRDCTMRQGSRRTASTKGKFLGANEINGPVDLYGSMILGTVVLNGKPVPRGPVGQDIRPW
jgi:hypothetical protein